MKKTRLIIMCCITLALFFAGCSNEGERLTNEKTNSKGVTINISAAASLSEALTEIQEQYVKESNDNLQFNFAGSGSLQKQIQEGVPCDLFISASKSHMDTLEKAGLINEDSRRDILGNTLTLIVSKEKTDIVKGVESFINKDVESIAIGQPETVPAGSYARQSFENLGILEQIEDKIIYAKDVKQVLEYVETGNIDAGLVYKSDAMLLETGVMVEDMPADSHDMIVYPAALIKDGQQVEAASEFYDFLQTDYAKEVFEKYGFSVL